jgi:peroxiredoxin
MKPVTILHILLTSALVAGTMSCSGKGGASVNKAPDFMLNDIDGNRFYLSEQKGKPVLLNFWSIHCAPCLVEMPKLQNLADSLSNKGVSFIGVCNDPGEEGYVESLLEKTGITYTNLIDEEKIVSEKYSVSALPATFIIDHSGTLRFHRVGYDEQYLEKYRNIIEIILHEKATKEL